MPTFTVHVYPTDPDIDLKFKLLINSFHVPIEQIDYLIIVAVFRRMVEKQTFDNLTIIPATLTNVSCFLNEMSQVTCLYIPANMFGMLFWWMKPQGHNLSDNQLRTLVKPFLFMEFNISHMSDPLHTRCVKFHIERCIQNIFANYERGAAINECRKLYRYYASVWHHLDVTTMFRSNGDVTSFLVDNPEYLRFGTDEQWFFGEAFPEEFAQATLLSI